MKLEDIKPFHYKFKVDDLQFKAVDINDDFLSIGVYDEGDLQVGEFIFDYDDDGHIETEDHPDFGGTLERLRKSGNSDEVMRHLHKIVDSLKD